MSAAGTMLVLGAFLALGLGVIGYRFQAAAYGWTVGEWYSHDTSFMKILGFVSLVSSAVMAFRWLHWTLAVVTIVGGIAAAFALTIIFRSAFQYVGLLLIPLFAASWWFLGVL